MDEHDYVKVTEHDDGSVTVDVRPPEGFVFARSEHPGGGHVVITYRRADGR